MSIKANKTLLLEMETLKINTLEQVPEGLNFLLAEFVKMQHTLAMLQPAPQPAAAEELLTRAQAAEALKVSLPTLNQLTKSGKIIGYRIGNRLRYKATEVNSALTQIKATALA